MLAYALAASMVTPPFASDPSAPAGLQIAGGSDRRAQRDARRAERRRELESRRDLEDFQIEPPRKGFYIGTGLASGATVEPNSFIPSIGYRFEIGGGLSDRVTLGISGGLTGHMGIVDGTAGAADIVLHTYVLRGAFVKLGLGATSHAPQRAQLKRPGYGGVVGLGWEFRPLKMLGVTLAGEYDARLRTDGRVSQALLLGFGLRFYPDFKKRW
jgi:hypothetical protein